MSTSKIIQYLLKYRPSSEWIIKESGIPYLKLNIDVPWSDILSEWNNVADLAVLHRSSDEYQQMSNNEWYSLVLYGSSPTDTAIINGEPHWTDIAERCPLTKKWISETFIINEKTGRIRFMLLGPGGHIVLHKDRDTKGLCEINVAITQPDNCEFRFKNYGAVPFKNGTAFMVDISNEHFLYNHSSEPRLHMILHTGVEQNIIKDSYANCFYS